MPIVGAATQAMMYWNGVLIQSSRGIDWDLGSEQIDTTVHGALSRSQITTFLTGEVSASGLFTTGTSAGDTDKIIADALAKTVRTWHIYPDRAVATRYFYGTAQVGISGGLPFDGAATVDLELLQQGDIKYYY